MSGRVHVGLGYFCRFGMMLCNWYNGRSLMLAKDQEHARRRM